MSPFDLASIILLPALWAGSFVLQRVIPNENMTTASFRGALDDLGASVVQTYPFWSVANWNSSSAPEEAASKSTAAVKGSAPQPAATAKPPAQQAVNDSKFKGAVQK